MRSEVVSLGAPGGMLIDPNSGCACKSVRKKSL